jgi:hypothetical protein
VIKDRRPLTDDPEIPPDVTDMAQFVNATAILGVVDDKRWEQIVLPILVNHREAAARASLSVSSTLDGAIQRAELVGGYKMAQRIINYLIVLRTRAAQTIEASRKTRPV